MSLKTNYKDEMLKSGEQRRYNLVASNGSTLYSNVRLEKAYTPQVEGDKFSAKDINDTNVAINDLEENYRKQYSTNEKFTGKYWIDGKKIYRKIYSIGTLTVGLKTIDTIPNFDRNISFSISMISYQNGDKISGMNGVANIDLFVSNDNKVYANSKDATRYNVVLILEYTKNDG